MIRRFIYNLIILLFSAYVLMLFAFSQLTYYMHPRYVTFAVVMAVIGAVFGVIGTVVQLVDQREALTAQFIKVMRAVKNDRKLTLFLVSLIVSILANLFFVVAALIIILPFPNSRFDKFLRENIWGEVLLCGVIFIAFLLPARPLTSATANQRSLDFNSLNVSDKLSAAQPFSFSSEKYTIGDWVTSLNLNTDLNSYVGKTVDVTGFVFTPEGLDQGQFMVSRFVVTCCAVDARPVGIIVKYDLADKFKQDDWVEIKGKFTLVSIKGVPQVAIEPDSIEKVDTPTYPYIF